METTTERNKLKEFEKRIRNLEHALAESRMRELLAEGHLRAICEEEGIKDLESRKKKLQGTPLDSQKKKPKGKKGSQ